LTLNLKSNIYLSFLSRLMEMSFLRIVSGMDEFYETNTGF
jgi:hypothetical protein